MEVFRLSHHTRGYLDVFTWIRNCMRTKVFVANLQTRNIDAFHGDLNMPRFRFFVVSLLSHSTVLSFEYLMIMVYLAEICVGFLHLGLPIRITGTC